MHIIPRPHRIHSTVRCTQAVNIIIVIGRMKVIALLFGYAGDELRWSCNNDISTASKQSGFGLNPGGLRELLTASSDE